MSDMLVKLYSLPKCSSIIRDQEKAGISISRAIPPEKHVLSNWVRQNFSAPWASECEIAFSRQPVACFTAIFENKPVGFSCYDTTCRGFLGPIGVHSEFRRKGIGKALLFAALDAMWAVGYAYAIVGAAGPQEFFKKATNAILIEGSSNSIYRTILR